MKCAISIPKGPENCKMGCCAVLSHQSCLTLCNPMDCSPPGSSVHGILQARILEWVTISYSRGSSWPRDWINISCISCIAGKLFTHWATFVISIIQVKTMIKSNTVGKTGKMYNTQHCWEMPTMLILMYGLVIVHNIISILKNSLVILNNIDNDASSDSEISSRK